MWLPFLRSETVNNWHTLTEALMFKLINNASFLIMVVSTMVISGIYKHQQILGALYGIVLRYVTNRKLLVLLLAASFQPVPSRTMLTTALVEGMASKDANRERLAVFSYMSTNHYYLWSPLEPSVIINMAALGLSYWQFLHYMMWPLVAYALVLTAYAIFFVDSDDFVQVPGRVATMSQSHRVDFFLLLLAIGLTVTQTLPDIKIDQLKINAMVWAAAVYASYLVLKYLPTREQLRSYINFKLVWIGLCVIVGAWVLGIYTKPILDFMNGLLLNQSLYVAASIGFLIAVILGASARFAATAVLLTKLCGMQYFTVFYIMELSGFIISPARHTFVLVQQYFKAKKLPYLLHILAFCIMMQAAAFITLL